MKRIVVAILALALSLSFSGCGTEDNPEPSDFGENSTAPTVMDANQNQNTGAPTQLGEEVLAPLFEIDYIPVASSQNRFIVRNESGNLYGLVDNSGNFILPCEYEELSFQQAKSQTVLKVMSKGSYGVFNLDGVELIPCEYTNIQLSHYNDLCIVGTFAGKYGVLDFEVNTVLPVEFDVVRFGYDKIIAAGKAATEEQNGIIATYDCEGNLIKDFLWEHDVEGIIIYNGGNYLQVTYGFRESGRVGRVDVAQLIVEGSDIISDTEVVGNKVFFFQGNDMIVRDMDSQQETVIWNFPDGRNSSQTDIRTSSSHIDPETGVESVDLFVVGIMDDAPQGEGYYIRITFGNQIDVISYPAYNLVNTTGIGDWDNIGDFYDGKALVFPQTGYLYTINTKGETIGEITNSYTNRTESLLLNDAAVLNNNGFYSIINSDGELLLSEDGYSDVQRVNVSGIYMVTDLEGRMGLINKFAEELVPCGGISSIESAIERPSNDNWDLESSHDTEDELYIIHNEDKWAVYSTTSGRLVTDFMNMSGDQLEQYNCMLGDTGYALIDEGGQTVYLVSYDGNKYIVYSYISYNI